MRVWLTGLAIFFTLAPMFRTEHSEARPVCHLDLPKTNNKDIVTLYGFIEEEVYWGPPNFGQNPDSDRKFNVLVLVLAHPIKVVEDEEFGIGGEILEIKRVQLHLVGTLISEGRAIVGQFAAVTGTIGLAVAPAEITQVTMSVSAIKAITQPISNPCEKGVFRKTSG